MWLIRLKNVLAYWKKNVNILLKNLHIDIIMQISCKFWAPMKAANFLSND